MAVATVPPPPSSRWTRCLACGGHLVPDYAVLLVSVSLIALGVMVGLSF